jgi:AraC-like DNA-binding protein
VCEASATVLFSQFARAAPTALRLPMPIDDRAADLARALLDDPANQDTLEQWARRLATSTSTLRRAFLAETGLTFTEWRTHARLDAAQRMLDDGWSVGRVARRVGYSSHSGFADAFRRHFGHAPATYRRRTSGPAGQPGG